jgi:outer membrane protein
LQEVIQESLFTNPVIISGKEEVNIAKSADGKAFAGYLPTVTLSGDMKNKTTDFGTTTTSSHPRIYQLAVNQTLFQGGGVLAENRSTRIGVKEAESQLVVTMQEQILACATAYMDVLQAKEVHKLNENLVDVLTKQKQATETQFKHGEVSKTDLLQASARLAQAKAQKVQAKSQMIQKNEALKAILGRVPTKVKWPDIATADIDVSQDMLDNVASNHPSVIKALMDLSQKKHGITKEKAGYYPTVTASAAIARHEGAVGTTSTDYTDRILGLNVSMDLFSGGSTIHSVKQAVSQKKQAEQTYEQARREVKEELINAHQAMVETYAVLQAFTESMEAEEKATEGVRREAALGARSTLDILDAEQSYLEAQVNLTQARRDSVISYYRFKAAMGELLELF